MRFGWRGMPTTRRLFPTVPARPKTARSPTSRSAPQPVRSKPARPAAAIARPSTISCCALKRSSRRAASTPARRQSRNWRFASRPNRARRIHMLRLVLLRHGESAWNRENRFTGWTDVDLTEKGRAEAREAGRLMSAEKFEFDLAYTSVLKRAIRTLWITLDEMDLMWIPVYRS